MLFWLKKVLTLPFLPLNFALLAGLIGLCLLFFSKRRLLGRGLLLAAVAALAAFSNKGIALLLIRPLESHYPALPASPLPPQTEGCRAIVVLGGGHSDSPEMSSVNQLSSSALARLAEGIRLARQLPRARLIVSGYNGPNRLTHAQVLANAAESLGMDPARITRFDDTRDTDDEAQAIRRELGPQPFLLVTSAWHMPRAMALCEKAGLHPVPAPADFMFKPGADSNWSLLTFDLGALERSTKAIHERLGLLWARLNNRA